ncbi:MAG TPA: dienelactone hydrolase family protein [Steroidobacteraceae bacterium]|nr:dienelactone hydrolase family protein [Steroidobacteraceae bacterium]
MHAERVSYRADGLAMDGQFYCEPGGAPRPGVLVFPDAFGLGKHALSRAERLAGLGFAALACDLHGERRVFGDLDEARKLISVLRGDVSRTRARALGGLQALQARTEVDPGRIAAIGYCFGGSMALELARSGAALAATVGFHSGLATTAPEDAKNIRGRVLVCIGADDPGIPLEQRNGFEAEMRSAKVHWQMTLFGGVVHSFTDPEADRLGRPEFARYDATADARSWQQMCALFSEVFGPH